MTERIAYQQKLQRQLDLEQMPQAPLMPFWGSAHSTINDAIPFTWEDYLQLVDTTGRMLRADKRGAIPDHIQPMIKWLGINPDHCLEHVQHFGRRYGGVQGLLKNCAHLRST